MADKKTTKKSTSVKVKDLAPKKDAVGGADELTRKPKITTVR